MNSDLTKFKEEWEELLTESGFIIGDEQKDQVVELLLDESCSVKRLIIIAGNETDRDEQKRKILEQLEEFELEQIELDENNAKNLKKHAKMRDALADAIISRLLSDDKDHVPKSQSYVISSSSDNDQDLSHYLAIGSMFINNPTDEINQIKAVLEEANKFHSLLASPYVFVCSSSGTGKTQLPFSLDIPLLYFVYNMSAAQTQKIYQVFGAQSRILNQLLIADQSSFEAAARSLNKLNSVYSSDQVLDVLVTGWKSKTYGFLVQFFKIVLQKAVNKTWMQAQLEVDAITFEPLNYSEVRTQFRGLNKKPVVFLDEVIDFVNPVTKNNQPSLNLRFVRSLLRLAHLVPVIMGTDTIASNFVSTEFSCNSRRDPITWCHLISKLPRVHSNFLFEEKCKIVKQMSTRNAPKKLLDMVNFLFDHLPQERPLFVKQIIKELSDIGHDRYLVEPCDLLDWIFSQVFVNFVNAKASRDEQMFIEGQFDFLNANIGKRSSAYIHKYIAYLDLPSGSYSTDQSANSLKLYLQNYSLNYTQVTDNQMYKEFGIMKSVLPRFDLEPITGLCFSGPKDVLRDTFPTRDKPLTLYSVTISKHENHSKATLDGDKLEHLAARALVLSSHANGLKGHVNFRHFFKYFICQLQLVNEVYAVDFDADKDTWDELDTTPIPYCSPVSGVSSLGGPEKVWNDGVFDYFTSQLQCSLGQVTEAKQGDTVDVGLYAGNHLNFKQLIDIECRLQQKANGIDDVVTKVKRFYTKNARILIILATKWAEITVELLEERVPDDVWIIKLVKCVERIPPIYGFKNLLKPQKVGRVCILVDLSTTT